MKKAMTRHKGVHIQFGTESLKTKTNKRTKKLNKKTTAELCIV